MLVDLVWVWVWVWLCVWPPFFLDCFWGELRGLAVPLFSLCLAAAWRMPSSRPRL